METNYEQWVRRQIGGRTPHSYQLRVAEAMWARRNVVVNAPTGAGKTLAVLGPYLYDCPRTGARRLIYCLPLRSLATGIYNEAKRVAGGSAVVTLQTGEQPDDPFFCIGDIIVTTYDQLVSSLLCASYAQTPRNQNVNAAVAVGNIVVFDEFHLMETGRAFMTAVECLRFFGDCVRSVWMTATATDPSVDYLKKRIGAVAEGLSESEEHDFVDTLGTDRQLVVEDHELTAADILRGAEHKTLVVVNQVKRAQELYREVAAELGMNRVRLLHARFFRNDREAAEGWIHQHFGKAASSGPVVAIATQVIEAGLDLSCERLLTDVCPMNALVQRAGRCARFQGQAGTVHVFPLGEGLSPLPYSADELNRTWEGLQSGIRLTPSVCRKWVGEIHRQQDERALRDFGTRRSACRETMLGRLQRTAVGGVGELIRGNSDTVRLIIREDPAGLLPSHAESIQVYRDQVARALRDSPSGWVFDPREGTWWQPAAESRDLRDAFAVCLPPAVANYCPKLGLRLGESGTFESPSRQSPKAPGYAPLREEGWAAHARAVRGKALEILDDQRHHSGLIEKLPQATRMRDVLGRTALLHDLGKLQAGWQAWAQRYQSQVAPEWVPDGPLAHTRYDSENREHRIADRAAGIRPPHACAGAYYAMKSLDRVPTDERSLWLASLTAIAAHHGAWLKNPAEVDALVAVAKGELRAIGIPFRPVPAPTRADLLQMERNLNAAEWFEEGWVLSAFFVRILRLSDRLATKEAASDE